ncbi:hypothetical protein Bpfe_008301 [Biomphalaria pfeifferi]|uniref:Uncharacterized protein n=1 Tax=Biomphalaria pfeifferi TaxID=112525 RepID=A0AAD8BX33_BIOPF|nr:hypothetical protein Bpfe_008301 [Biomphalaria pfeifferi]
MSACGCHVRQVNDVRARVIVCSGDGYRSLKGPLARLCAGLVGRLSAGSVDDGHLRGKLSNPPGGMSAQIQKQPRYKPSVAAQIQTISRSSTTDECHDRTVKANSPENMTRQIANSPENMTRQIVCNRQSDQV